MSIFSKVRNVFSHIPKKVAVISGILAAVMVPIAISAYGPVRDTFTIENPADHVTFNSITNNPNIGDERNFVGARDASTGNNGINNTWSANQITVEDGKEYYVRMYVHNNAAANLGLVAENVTAKFNVPTTTGKSVTVSGILNSSNATPTEYWDSVEFVSDTNFNLAYVAGSARYENNAIGAGGTGGVALSDSIVTNSGVLLGYDKLDGKIPGCFQYAGYVTFKVEVQMEHVARIGLTKSVAYHNTIADPSDKLDNTNWQQTIEAKPGEVVDYVIAYRNAGTGNQSGVVVRDMLPSNMTYIPGSTKYVIYASDGTLYREGDWGGEDTITTTGINASEANSGFKPTQHKYSYVAMFSARVNDNLELECGTSTILKNVARVSATVDGERFYNENDADVVINAEECEIPEEFCEVPGKEHLPKDSPDCKEDEKDEFCEVPGKEHLPKDSPDCKEDEKEEFCEVPGKEHLPKDSPDCVSKTVDEPTEIPKTGIEAIGILGLGSLTTAGAYYISSRRK